MSEMNLFIVDDDPAIRDSLSLLLGIQNYRVAVFSDATSFLKAYRKDWKGCVLLDIRMPGTDGLALQQKLTEMGSPLVVIIMTGHGDVASARTAFRSNAVDFLEKPLDNRKLRSAISDAFPRLHFQKDASEQKDELDRLLASLTPREREVKDRVVAGLHNREIAAELGISPRTVEVHKARMMDKMGVGNVADLVRLTLKQSA